MGRDGTWERAARQRTLYRVFSCLPALAALLLALAACVPEVTPIPKLPPAPIPEPGQFSITLGAPPSVEPGARFEYTLTVTNQADISAQGVLITFDVPPELTIAAVSDSGMVDGNQVRWVLAEMVGGAEVSHRVSVEAPWTQAVLVAQEYDVRVGDWPQPVGGAPVRTRIEGGIASIDVTRALLGERVTIEGLTTMVDQGDRAGDGGEWFYLQDESGGIRVQLSDPEVRLPALTLGAHVRVSGEVVDHLGSLRVVVGGPGAVGVLDRGEPPAPEQFTIAQVAHGAPVAGRLIAVTGQAIRVAEFADVYEIDLAGDQGDVLLVTFDIVDALAALDLEIERIEVGRQYTVAGIGEMVGERFHLMGRMAADVSEVPHPALALEGYAPPNVLPGDTLVYSLTVVNYTAAPLANVVITSSLPTEHAILPVVFDDGELITGTLRWSIPTLSPREARSVRFAVAVTGAISGQPGVVSLHDYAAWADGWPFREAGLALRTFISDSVPIHAVQGAGFVSPYVLDVVRVEGVVTAVFPGLGGFWIQELRPDDDPFTSEGLFIYVGATGLRGGLDLAAGDRVRVRGRVRERWGQTEMHAAARADVVVVDSELDLPEPVELEPPVGAGAAAAYYEPLEGMLVSVTDAAVVVAPTSGQGEYGLVQAGRGVDRVLQGQETGSLIMVDDGSLSWHADSTTISVTVRTGDRVGNLVGPLAFTSGQHKIEPILPPEIRSVPAEPVEPLPLPGPDEFSIATFNTASGAPHGPGGLPVRGDLERKRDVIAATVVALGAPTIVGLQGVEHEGLLADVASEPALAAYEYQPAFLSAAGTPAGGVGFLVRGDRAALEGVGRSRAPGGLFAQPPLMITTTVSLPSGGVSPDQATVYAVVNQFAPQMGSGALSGPLRAMQAAWNAELVDEILIHDPAAYVVVVGALNDGPDSASLRALTAGPIPGGRLANAAEVLPAGGRYSTITQGVSRLLDYILVTPALAARQVRADVLHVNADYPPPNPANPVLYRSSAHDPVVAVFQLGE